MFASTTNCKNIFFSCFQSSSVPAVALVRALFPLCRTDLLLLLDCLRCAVPKEGNEQLVLLLYWFTLLFSHTSTF